MALVGWSEFNVAIAGASAALAGLIIVALSVNVTKILTNRTLPARAASAIASLVISVLACGIALIPGQSLLLIGLELAAPVAVGALLAFFAVRRIVVEPVVGFGNKTAKLSTVVIPPLAFVVGDVMLIAQHPAGYSFVAFASLVAICGAVLFSWIALVEVLR